MGRPLNKRFFGNRNVGTTGTTDDGIGGQGLASISVATAGNFVVNNTYQNFPQLTITAPQLPTGVQATADVVFEIDTVTYTSGGQTNADYVAGLSTTITGLGGGAIINITEVTSKVTAVDVTTAGTNRGEFRRGDFTGAAIASHQVLQAPNAGTDLQVTFTFRVKSITVVEKGSGYTAVPTLAWTGHTFTGQTTPSGNTPTLTTDSGALNTTNASTNQQNAIIAYAYVTGNNLIADIKKQVSGRRYKVTTTEGTLTCKLVTDGVANAVGEMTITATDANGNTYYVSKLTRHKASLVRLVDDGEDGDWLYANNGVAPWGYAAAAGLVVQIANA
jgi:hypothetical protein